MRITTSDPPNILKNADLNTFLTAHFGKELPDPSTGQYLYTIFMPPKVAPNYPAGGAHNQFPLASGGNYYWAYACNGGNLDSITVTFSHELAEACSDPAGGGGVAISHSEIGDYCGAYRGTLNGVAVQAYWSQSDDACIIPTLQFPSIGRWWKIPWGSVTGPVLGPIGTAGLAVAHNQDGTMELFCRVISDGTIVHTRETGPSDFDSAWETLGGTPTLPKGGALIGSNSASLNKDGYIEVFVTGVDGKVYHTNQIFTSAPPDQSGASPTNWSGWSSLPSMVSPIPHRRGTPPTIVAPVGPPCVAKNAAGLLEVFVCGADQTLWHISESSSGWDPAWTSLGGQILTGGPNPFPVVCVGTNPGGRLEVFVQAQDKTLYHNWQTSVPNAATPAPWSGWNQLGKQVVTQAVVGHNKDGRLEVFAIGTDSALWHISQTAATDWGHAWNSLGGSIQELVTVGSNADGRIEVFVRGGGNSRAFHNSQNHPNAGSGDWSGWTYLDTYLQFNALQVASNNGDGRLELFGIGLDGQLYHLWQIHPSNGWNW